MIKYYNDETQVCKCIKDGNVVYTDSVFNIIVEYIEDTRSKKHVSSSQKPPHEELLGNAYEELFAIGAVLQRIRSPHSTETNTNTMYLFWLYYTKNVCFLIERLQLSKVRLNTKYVFENEGG